MSLSFGKTVPTRGLRRQCASPTVGEKHGGRLGKSAGLRGKCRPDETGSADD